jgi:hypothetical protein
MLRHPLVMLYQLPREEVFDIELLLEELLVEFPLVELLIIVELLLIVALLWVELLSVELPLDKTVLVVVTVVVVVVFCVVRMTGKDSEELFKKEPLLNCCVLNHRFQQKYCRMIESEAEILELVRLVQGLV